MTVNFLMYPEINGDHSFPPEVNQAIADAPELEAKYLLKSDVPVGGGGEGGPITVIDGGRP